MTVIHKWHFSVLFCVLSVAVFPIIYYIDSFSTETFKLETSLWCDRSSSRTKLCKFKNICYDSEFKAFLFFLANGTVIRGFKNYKEFQKIQLSSVEEHNQFYANISVISTENFKLTKDLQIYSKALLFSRFKPNNIMHATHDDIFPVFLTLESVCLGDLQCMESYTLMFHDSHPEGPFFNLYKLFSKHSPILLNEYSGSSNIILCFKEMLTGLILDGVFYQYGFKKPHGPVKNNLLTQHDVLRFTSFIKDKLKIKKEVNNVSEVIMFKRGKNRKILNINKVKEMVGDVYGKLNKKIEVKIINLDLFTNDLTGLISRISQADGLIGMHGAEMILSLFLKQNSYVFEIFPFGIKPEVVSFIKPVSELDGSNFIYFPWRNIWRNNSVFHPDAHPHFGGISHLYKEIQNKIKTTDEVPATECCNNALFLYYMYQDTLVSNEFLNYLYESIRKTLTHDLQPEKITKKWFFPYTVYNISCNFQSQRNSLHINWKPPFNVDCNNVWYSLFVQDQKRLFSKDISTDKTTLEIKAPVGVNPVFEIWISVYFRSNNNKSPDLYIICY